MAVPAMMMAVVAVMAMRAVVPMADPNAVAADAAARMVATSYPPRLLDRRGRLSLRAQRNETSACRRGLGASNGQSDDQQRGGCQRFESMTNHWCSFHGRSIPGRTR
jgi:hypothetical protein